MAIDAYMTFTPYIGPPLTCESTVDFTGTTGELASGMTAGQVFEIDAQH
jgi:hypothetical protein